MDVLPRITRQLMELFREMSPVQRATSLAVVCLILFGFGWVVCVNQRTDFQAVSYGKVFAPDELHSAERALSSAGLTSFRREGQRILVPGKELDRYNAALLESDALPADLGTQMLKQYETLGPFSTDRQRQQMKEALLLQELRRMIKAVPDVEDASVAIALSDRRAGWNQKPRATANVSVKPRFGRELSGSLINSLRHVVANMVPDLKPGDVTVFDVTRGQAFMGEPTSDPTDSLYLQRAREFTRQYEQQIQKALSYIPNISVTVHVDLDTLKSSMVRSEKVRTRSDDGHVANRPGTIDDGDTGLPQKYANANRDPHMPDATDFPNSHLTGFRGSNVTPTETIREVSEKQLYAALPKSVQVSVSLPRDFLREVIARRIAKGETSERRIDPAIAEEEELTKVERIVGRLIPADSSSNAISVMWVDRLGNDVPEIASLTTYEQIVILLNLWGSLFAIGCFVLVAIWVLFRKPSVVQPKNSGADGVSVPVNFQQSPSPIESNRTPVLTQDRTAILRNEVRAMVESDPAASVSVLCRWLAEVQKSS